MLVVGFTDSFKSQQKSTIRLTVKTNPNLSYTTLLNEAYVLHGLSNITHKKTLSNQVETQILGSPSLRVPRRIFHTVFTRAK